MKEKRTNYIYYNRLSLLFPFSPFHPVPRYTFSGPRFRVRMCEGGERVKRANDRIAASRARFVWIPTDERTTSTAPELRLESAADSLVTNSVTQIAITSCSALAVAGAV